MSLTRKVSYFMDTPVWYVFLKLVSRDELKSYERRINILEEELTKYKQSSRKGSRTFLKPVLSSLPSLPTCCGKPNTKNPKTQNIWREYIFVQFCHTRACHVLATFLLPHTISVRTMCPYSFAIQWCPQFMLTSEIRLQDANFFENRCYPMMSKIAVKCHL